jgi:outer membrane autotransporter protein
MTGPGTGPVFSGGTMQITGAGVSSALPVFLGPGGGTVDTQANSATFSGIISGPGSLTKIGTGTLILSGDSSYSGPTSVGGGTLVVNGSIAASVVTVNPGAVLRGDGILGGLSLGGTLAPCNSIGTLHVFGNATFAAGSTYEVEINAAGQSDLLAVTGTVTLGGGEVIVLSAPGSYAPGTVYTIVTAGGGVSGTFDGVTDSLPLFDAVLSYLPGSVLLALERNAQTIASLGITPNQRATGAGIDSLGGGVLETALANLGASDIPAALDLLSGEIHASAKSGFIEESRYLREAASGRLRAAFGAVGAKPLPVMAYGEAGPVAAAADAPLAMWGEGLGAWGSFDGDGNAADFDRSTGGFFTGIDALVADDARLGLIGGYTYSSFDVDERASSGSANSVHIGAYGGTQLGNFGLRAVAAYSWNFVDTSRTAAFGGFAENLDASYDAGTAQVFGEAGYRIDTASASFEPFANVAYVNLHTDGFTETGGAAALAHQSDDTDQTFTTLGVRASTPLQLGDKEVKLSGMVGWRHAFSDITPEAAFAFAGGAPFVIAGTPIARDALALEVGLDVQIGPRSSLGIAYSGQIGDDAQDHSANATLTVSF